MLLEVRRVVTLRMGDIWKEGSPRRLLGAVSYFLLNVLATWVCPVVKAHRVVP